MTIDRQRRGDDRRRCRDGNAVVSEAVLAVGERTGKCGVRVARNPPRVDRRAVLIDIGLVIIIVHDRTRIVVMMRG